MGARGPKPQGLRQLSLKMPGHQWAIYKAEAERLGMPWSHYVCSVLATAHGLDPVGTQRPIDPQPQLPFDDEKGAA
jgi:hypothetical protein